ncbi:hypothetical protein [Frigidibacter oleivorans]|uniref:hypothetical protein n=1 Tax=Frigidibacter oleivorans TaxID=2487129 RepID=UPI0013DF883E|nr:hypothetical protein [Frigidibacter oleivorans]
MIWKFLFRRRFRGSPAPAPRPGDALLDHPALVGLCPAQLADLPLPRPRRG